MIFDVLIQPNFVENDPFFIENDLISHFFVQNGSKSGHISENRAILDEKMGKSDENFGGPKSPTKGLRFESIQPQIARFFIKKLMTKWHYRQLKAM